MKPRFIDKVVIVTGGSGGLGQSYCYAFAREGAKVACAYNNNQDGAKATVAEIARVGGKGLAIKMDVSDAQSVQAAVSQIVETFGAIDVLVNNAGVIVRQGLLDTTEEDWDKETNIDLKGTFLATKAVIPQMVKKKYGKVVNITSIAGVTGLTSVPYTASKAGVIGMTRVLALEFAPYRICINALAPGFIATPISEKLRKTPVGKEIDERIPFGYGTVDSVTPAVLFLSSSESDYITGQCLVVDGGLTCSQDMGPSYRTFGKTSNSSRPVT